MGFGVRRGHELLRMIRARNDSVPIVVLSSRGDELGKVQALDLGADDYVTKPFGMEELLARLRAALRHATPLWSLFVVVGYHGHKHRKGEIGNVL